MFGVESIDDGASLPFSGPRQLASMLAASPNVQACAVQQWYRYAQGREIQPEDRCSVRALTQRFMTADLAMQTMFLDIVTLPAFVLRRASEVQ